MNYYETLDPKSKNSSEMISYLLIPGFGYFDNEEISFISSVLSN